MRYVMANVYYLMAFIIPLYAMNHEERSSSTTLSHAYLELISLDEESARSMTLAQTQIFNVTAWAQQMKDPHYVSSEQLSTHITESCPFSLGDLGPPHKLAQLINNHIPTNAYAAQVIGHDVLSEGELFKIIKINITNNRPVLIYFIDNEHYQLATIVGYTINTKSPKKSNIQLKTYAHMAPFSITLDNLLKMMDLSKNRELLAWMSSSSKFFRNKDHATLLNDLLAQLRNFTIIAFDRYVQPNPDTFSYPCQLL